MENPYKFGRGPSVLAVSDIANVGRQDIVVGAYDENKIHVFYQQADDTYRQVSPVPFLYGGPQQLLAGGGGYLAMRSGLGCGEARGTQFVAQQKSGPGGAWRELTVSPEEFHLNDNQVFPGWSNYFINSRAGPIVPARILGTNNQDGLYRVHKGISTGIQQFGAFAQSKVVSTTDPATTSIVDATITKLGIAGTIPISNWRIKLSNDGGATWETLTVDEMKGLESHRFKSFGGLLRWNSLIPLTSTLSNIQIQYRTANQGYFSRSDVVTGNILVGSSTRRYLFSAGFNFPGWTSTITAGDISSDREPIAGELVTLLNPQAPLNNGVAKWDTGSILLSKTSQTLYTMVPKLPLGYNTITGDLLNFNFTELSTPTSSPSLQTMMSVSDDEKKDVMNFLQSTRNSSPPGRMFDTGHSSPVLINPPSQDAAYMGPNYNTFRSKWKTRPGTILQAGNDGFLRAFATGAGGESGGQQRWAYTPYNILGRMKTQRGLGAKANSVYY
ncbi:MAG: hypothetical protein EOO38_13885, partial [Cytophagaceae bacterium]